MRSRNQIRDCPLITAGLGRGCPDSSYDMDDTVFTGIGCNTLIILSDKRFDISGLSCWEAEVVKFMQMEEMKEARSALGFQC